MFHREHKATYCEFFWGSVHWNEYTSVHVCSSPFRSSYQSISKFHMTLSAWYLSGQSSYHNSLDIHSVWSVQIRSFSGPYFPAFGLNTERYFSDEVQKRFKNTWLFCPKVSKINRANFSLLFKTWYF